jgi:hypothetical protein
MGLVLTGLGDGGAPVWTDIQVAVEGDGNVYVSVYEPGTGGEQDLSFTPPLTATVATWHAVSLGATDTDFTVTFDDRVLGPLPHRLKAPLQIELSLGAHAPRNPTGSTGWDFAYDNVVCQP